MKGNFSKYRQNDENTASVPPGTFPFAQTVTLNSGCNGDSGEEGAGDQQVPKLQGDSGNLAQLPSGFVKLRAGP